MLSVAVAALAFQAPPSLTRRDAVFAGVTAAAMPFAAFADGSAGPGTLQKARLSYGQRLLTLQDASTDAILENKATINLYVSAVNRAKGAKVDPRKSEANAIIAAAKVCCGVMNCPF